MEQNEEHLTMNILIYYACKTEQHASSYDGLNMHTYYEFFQGQLKIRRSEKMCWAESGDLGLLTLGQAHGEQPLILRPVHTLAILRPSIFDQVPG